MLYLTLFSVKYSLKAGFWLKIPRFSTDNPLFLFNFAHLPKKGKLIYE